MSEWSIVNGHTVNGRGQRRWTTATTVNVSTQSMVNGNGTSPFARRLSIDPPTADHLHFLPDTLVAYDLLPASVGWTRWRARPLRARR